jgi:hypothetical protein
MQEIRRDQDRPPVDEVETREHALRDALHEIESLGHKDCLTVEGYVRAVRRIAHVALSRFR